MTKVTKSVISFRQWEFLNHAINVLQLGEFDGLLGVSRMATRPGLYRESIAKLCYDQLCFALESMSIPILPGRQCLREFRPGLESTLLEPLKGKHQFHQGKLT